MRTNQFKSLQQAALSVSAPHLMPINENVQHVEYIEEQVADIPTELVEFVANVIESAEERLKTTFTAQEINETTKYIVQKLQVENLIESIENQVGFELNEAEVDYVFNTLQNL
jgi:hypothetical protein